MGYDMYVILNVMINPISGIPCEYTSNGLIDLNLCNYVVPKEHRKYISNHGWIFDMYIPRMCKDDLSYSVEALYLAKHIPSWEEFKPKIPADWEGEWLEVDHNGFKAAMEWFGAKGCYTVHWSY
jgi:hypothetical protein